MNFKIQDYITNNHTIDIFLIGRPRTTNTLSVVAKNQRLGILKWILKNWSFRPLPSRRELLRPIEAMSLIIPNKTVAEKTI